METNNNYNNSSNYKSEEVGKQGLIALFLILIRVRFNNFKPILIGFKVGNPLFRGRMKNGLTIQIRMFMH